MGDVRFSKFMVKILRHSARENGVQISSDGYANVEDILQAEGNRHTLEDVEDIVKCDDKGRFAIRTMNGKRQIKATQGHSMTLRDHELEPILRADQVKAVLHGTKKRLWPDIKSKGLSRMGRQHIHFAQAESGVQSGFPPGCDMVIEIDLGKALSGGIKFFKSENGVILTEGNSSGVVPKQYFKQAYTLGRTREDLSF